MATSFLDGYLPYLLRQADQIVHGENVITFDSPTREHGRDIFWPGPALLLRFDDDADDLCEDSDVARAGPCEQGIAIDADRCNANCPAQAEPAG